MKKINLLGDRFNRLVVVDDANRSIHGHSVWICRCDCGILIEAISNNLRKGNTNSCGCYKRERIRETATSHGEADKAPEYRNWLALKNRCKNKSQRNYNSYGGRGIKVCKRWLNSYQNFINDMGRRPTPVHSIDRINVNGNYTPTNCRWATPKEQANNKRKKIENKN